MIAAWLALSSASAVECPEGWMDRGCPPGVKPENGCCPTRVFCESELVIERRKAARRHLGKRYDDAVAKYDEAWAIASSEASACIDALDIALCGPALDKIHAYLRLPDQFRLRITGGNDTVQTSCGEERVFFNGDTVAFDAPNRDEASVVRDQLRDMQSQIVGPGQKIRPEPSFRPAGAPKTPSSTRPAGVRAGSSAGDGIHYGLFYTTNGQPGPTLDQLRLFKGRFEACYMKIHPGWRMAPNEFVMTWETSAGRVQRIQFPHDGMGHPELRSCLSGVLANVPMSQVRDGRSSLVFTTSATAAQ